MSDDKTNQSSGVESAYRLLNQQFVGDDQVLKIYADDIDAAIAQIIVEEDGKRVSMTEELGNSEFVVKIG